MEPTVEGGDTVWKVATSCVNMYKAGRKCTDADASTELCCTTEDKEVFANAWSLTQQASGASMLTANATLFKSMVASGGGCDLDLRLPT